MRTWCVIRTSNRTLASTMKRAAWISSAFVNVHDPKIVCDFRMTSRVTSIGVRSCPMPTRAALSQRPQAQESLDTCTGTP